MSLLKVVNGVSIPMSPEEESDILLDWTPTQAKIDAAARVTKDAADALAAKQDVQLAAIAAMTPAQAAQWIEDNVTTLASAKVALKFMAKAICVLARKL